MDEAIQRLAEEELGEIVILGYGRGLLVENFRKLGHPVRRYLSYDSLFLLTLTCLLTCLRDRLFAQYRALIPDAVDHHCWPESSVARRWS